MNHEEALRLLGPYRDGELDLTTCLALEAHLAGCPACQEKLGEERELADLIVAQAPRFSPSPFLKTRLLAALREQESATESIPWWRHFSLRWAYGGMAGAAALLVLFALGMFETQGLPGLAQEAVANHVRSLQANHLMDVASTDQHTVKPWFAGRLDYSPQVVDLGPSGYPLIGGRLDILDHREVAAIIYQRRKHYINLFIWPSDSASVGNRIYDQHGYHVLSWKKSGMNYLAVSELGEKELREFAKMIQDQTVDAPQ